MRSRRTGFFKRLPNTRTGFKDLAFRVADFVLPGPTKNLQNNGPDPQKAIILHTFVLQVRAYLVVVV